MRAQHFDHQLQVHLAEKLFDHRLEFIAGPRLHMQWICARVLNAPVSQVKQNQFYEQWYIKQLKLTNHSWKPPPPSEAKQLAIAACHLQKTRQSVLARWMHYKWIIFLQAQSRLFFSIHNRSKACMVHCTPLLMGTYPAASYVLQSSWLGIAI